MSWHQVWYADDAGIYGTLRDIRRIYLKLSTIGPVWGYIHEPTKSILVIQEESFDNANVQLGDLNFRIQSGARYLGGYIGDEVKKEAWSEEKVHVWGNAIGAMILIARYQPQCAYAGTQRSLQQEWQFLQRNVTLAGSRFIQLKEAIARQFLPQVFDVQPPPPEITNLSVKGGGVGITDPCDTTEINRSALMTMPLYLANSIVDDSEF